MNSGRIAQWRRVYRCVKKEYGTYLSFTSVYSFISTSISLSSLRLPLSPFPSPLPSQFSSLSPSSFPSWSSPPSLDSKIYLKGEAHRTIRPVFPFVKNQRYLANTELKRKYAFCTINDMFKWQINLIRRGPNRYRTFATFPTLLGSYCLLPLKGLIHVDCQYPMVRYTVSFRLTQIPEYHAVPMNKESQSSGRCRNQELWYYFTYVATAFLWMQNLPIRRKEPVS